MLLQPGYGMGLLNAYNTPYQPINPQMDHYNGLLGRISGMNFPTNQFDPTMVNQGIGNYWNGNVLMSGATAGPVSNLPQGAGAMYGTTQSYMDQLGRMPNQASEIISPYIYHRPATDPAALASASDLIQNPPPEEVVQNVSGWGHGGGGRPDPQPHSDQNAPNHPSQGNFGQDNSAGTSSPSNSPGHPSNM